jgi:hypothetical protein
MTYQEVWARQEIHEGEDRNKRKSRLRNEPLDNKESKRWIDGVEACLPLIAAGLDVVQIGDREADIFEFMLKAQQVGSSFLVRSKSDRNVEVQTPGGQTVIKSLHSYASAAKILATAEINIVGNSERKAKKVSTSIRKQDITLLVPKSNRKACDVVGLTPIKASVIVVKSRAKIDGEILNWILLTDRESNTVEDLIKLIEWYKTRWQIEIFHKTLKSGCNIEESRLSNLDRLAPYLLMKSIAAVRVMSLTYSARQTPEAPASDFFSADEWQVLKVALYKKGELGRRRARIKDVAQKIAIRGGYLPGKNRYPGVTVMWRGWDILQAGMDLLKDLSDKDFRTCVR